MGLRHKIKPLPQWLNDLWLRAASYRSPSDPSRTQSRPSSLQISYAKFFSRSHDAVIRVFDEASNVIETHEQAGDFKEW